MYRLLLTVLTNELMTFAQQTFIFIYNIGVFGFRVIKDRGNMPTIYYRQLQSYLRFIEIAQSTGIELDYPRVVLNLVNMLRNWHRHCNSTPFSIESWLFHQWAGPNVKWALSAELLVVL